MFETKNRPLTTPEIHVPANLDELQKLVAWAVAEEIPLLVEGAGSKRGFGHHVDATHGVSTRAMTGVTLYEPDELVMSAAAGTKLAEIELLLDEQRQMLAFEPADYGCILGGPAGAQTIGGIFACNLSGPRRLKTGAARDHLLGLNCVTGHGQVIKTGGRVMKNVTGYDLCKLFAGSFGTLAVMSHLTFKVLPALEFEVTLALLGDDVPTLLGQLRKAMGSGWEVSSAAVIPPAASVRSSIASVAAAGEALALLRLEGTEPSVRYRQERLQTELVPKESAVIEAKNSRQLWREIRDVALLPHDRPILWRISCPPAAAAAIAEQLHGEMMFDWAGGLIWVASETPDTQTIRASLETIGGHATLIRATSEMRAAHPVFHPQEPGLAKLTARVKTSFDPKNILNPGRMGDADKL